MRPPRLTRSGTIIRLLCLQRYVCGQKLTRGCKTATPKYFCHSYVSRTHGYCGIVNQPNVLNDSSKICPWFILSDPRFVSLSGIHGEAKRDFGTYFGTPSSTLHWVAADQICRLASSGIQLIVEVYIYIYRPIESSNFKRVFWEGGMILKEESSVRVRCSFRCLMSVVGRVTS